MNDPALVRLFRVSTLVIGILLAGALGYTLLEGWPLYDGFYMTIITLSTVGYGETHELSTAGRLFTSLLIFVCIGTMTAFSAALTSFHIGNDLGGRLIRKRVLRMISSLKGHTIVCGASLMGKTVIEELYSKKEPLVVIDIDEETLRHLKEIYPKLLTITGSATNEVTLADANLLDAKNVVAALDSEVDNLLVSITCKDMGHNLRVFARSNDTTIANRMRQAGVDEVIAPSLLTGCQIAESILT